MNKWIGITLGGLIGLLGLMGGCATQQGNNALAGGAIGAGLGGLIGGDAGSAVAGGAIGAGSGYLLTPNKKCRRCVSWYNNGNCKRYKWRSC